MKTECEGELLPGYTDRATGFEKAIGGERRGTTTRRHNNPFWMQLKVKLPIANGEQIGGTVTAAVVRDRGVVGAGHGG